MKKHGIPDDVITIIKNLYDDGQRAVKWSGVIGEWFIVITGIRQGCILYPLLFALVMDWIIRTALNGLDVGIKWIYGSRLCDLDYADDIVLIDSTHERMQKMTAAVENRGKKVGLYMNEDKCKVMISNDWKDNTETKIGSKDIDVIEEFCYLGSCVLNNSSCDKDCQTRIGKANSVFGRLKSVWKNKQISITLKLRLDKSVHNAIRSRTVVPVSRTKEEA